MNKEYVCTIDHAKFNTEEALIKHLLSNFTISQEKGEGKSKILKKLQTEFPDAAIEITTSEHMPKTTKKVLLTLSGLNTEFEFYITKSPESDYFYEEMAFKTVDEAIKHYKNILNEKDKLILAIIDKFQADVVRINYIHESACSHSDSLIHFSFYINDKEYNGNYLFDGIENCLKKLEGYFIDHVEGECILDFSGYESTNTVYINGVDIKDIAKRAKVLRVEIIESK